MTKKILVVRWVYFLPDMLPDMAQKLERHKDNFCEI